MKNKLQKIFLALMLSLNIGVFASNCGTTINDIDVTSISSNLINFDFTANVTSNCIGYEFDLYINNTLENSIIINSPSALSGSISSSVNILDKCIKLVGRSRCAGGGLGDDFSIIVTVDDLWDCIDFNDICNHSKKKLINFSFQNNIKVVFDLDCFCSSINTDLVMNPELLKNLFINKLSETKNHRQQNSQWQSFYQNYENCIKYKSLASFENKKGLDNIMNVSIKSLMYPNPSKGKIFIDENLIKNLEIFSLLGDKITFTTYNNEVVIDDNTKGLLIFKSSYKGKSIIEKILIK